MTIEEICKILGKEIPKDQKEELEIIKEIFHKEGKETEKGEYDFGEVKGKLSAAFQDFMVRYPLKRMKYRPEFTKEGARVRQKEEQDEK